MKTALFTNWTKEDFEGFWDGKGRVIEAGESEYLPDWLASHFATGLANRELVRREYNEETKKNELVIPDGDKYTSPKFPDQVKTFKDLYDKAYKEDETREEENKTQLEVDIEIANKDRKKAEAVAATNQLPKDDKNQNPNEPQILSSPDDESFGDSPVENKNLADKN